MISDQNLPIEDPEASSAADSSGWSLDAEPVEEETQPLPSSTPPPVDRILEALLFVGGEPLTLARAKSAIRGLHQEQLDDCLAALGKRYTAQGRPYSIQRIGEGYILALRPRFKQVEETLKGQIREARLSPPAIDVLALVAYRQPIGRQEIDAIRGVDSGPLVRMLLKRGLIASLPTAGDQKESSYATTQKFLELFRLSSLEDLPQTMDLQQL